MMPWLLSGLGLVILLMAGDSLVKGAVNDTWAHPQVGQTFFRKQTRHGVREQLLFLAPRLNNL